MKKILILPALFALSVLLLSGCKNKEPKFDNLSLNPTTLSMKVGETLSVTIPTGSGQYTATSNNQSVATALLSGKTLTVTAKAKGDAVITVTDKMTKQSAQVNVSVTEVVPPGPVTGVSVTPESQTIEVGYKFTLKATVLPYNAGNKKVTFSSDAPSIAEVNATTGVVTGVAIGNATITATTEEGGKEATCVVTVTAPTAKKIILTTTKGIGEQITLSISAANAGDEANCWIDLNNNGLKEEGEKVTTFGRAASYPLGAQTVTLHGKVTVLYCENNSLTALDVTHNTALTRLECRQNQLTALDVSKNIALTALVCFSNQLNALDVTNNTALESLVCAYNSLTALDVTKNTALTTLYCNNNQLTALDVTNNTALKSLVCEYNSLTALDVSKNTALTYLVCEYNSLTALDVSKNTALEILVCEYNSLTALDVSKNTALESLVCAYNSLTALDVTKNTALTTLVCFKNQLKQGAVNKLLNDLPMRQATDDAKLYLIWKPDQNYEPTEAEKQVVTAKNWTVRIE